MLSMLAEADNRWGDRTSRLEKAVHHPHAIISGEGVESRGGAIGPSVQTLNHLTAAFALRYILIIYGKEFDVEPIGILAPIGSLLLGLEYQLPGLPKGDSNGGDEAKH
jgi:hypothetical protein